jgi:hypothetical protein
MREMRNPYNIMVKKLEEKRPLGTPRYKWEDNIRMDLWEIGWETGPVAESCEHGNECLSSIKIGEFLE